MSDSRIRYSRFQYPVSDFGNLHDPCARALPESFERPRKLAGMRRLMDAKRVVGCITYFALRAWFAFPAPWVEQRLADKLSGFVDFMHLRSLHAFASRR